MVRNAAATSRLGSGHAMAFDFGNLPPGGDYRRGLRLAVSSHVRGPEKYRALEVKRRRAQIRARRVLGLD